MDCYVAHLLLWHINTVVNVYWYCSKPDSCRAGLHVSNSVLARVSNWRKQQATDCCAVLYSNISRPLSPFAHWKHCRKSDAHGPQTSSYLCTHYLNSAQIAVIQNCLSTGKHFQMWECYPKWTWGRFRPAQNCCSIWSEGGGFIWFICMIETLRDVTARTAKSNRV